MTRMNTKACSLAAIAVAGLLSFACGGDAPATSTTSNNTGAPAATTAAQSRNDPASLAAAAVTSQIEATTRAVAALGPHSQSSYPPIPFQAYAPPRPPEVVTAAFQFAAEHPEISSYVPCFCGCQQGGHKGNHDCFVRSRAANGDVIEWEPHGVECAVCIDVATRSRQLLNSGASVQEIRAAIEREFLPSAATMTPTPKPPAAAHSH
jgi:hypothetical protein